MTSVGVEINQFNRLLNDETIRDAISLWFSDRPQAENLYGHISTWDTSQVTNMSHLFEGKREFNEDISKWDVRNVKDISCMFAGAISFQVCLKEWDIRSVDKFNNLYLGCKRDQLYVINLSMDDNTIQEAVSDWLVDKARAISKHGHISTWKVTLVSRLGHLFENKKDFNEDITDWDVRNVKNMSFMFAGATSFNQPIQKWNIANVTDMSHMFRNAIAFNQRLDCWILNADVDNSGMFAGALRFDFNYPPIKEESKYYRTATTDNFYFDDDTIRHAVALWFDSRSMAQQSYGHISKWNTSKVTNMSYLFESRVDFNEDIGGWDVSKVINMNGMFLNATSFNISLKNWKVDNVVDMSFMFVGARRFNSDLSEWNVTNVKTFEGFLAAAVSYSRTLVEWSIDSSSNTSMVYEGLSIENINQINFPFSNRALREAVNLWCSDKTAAERVYGDIAQWNTSSVTDMSRLFENKAQFSDNINSWDTKNVKRFTDIFLGADSFEGSLFTWKSAAEDSEVLEHLKPYLLNSQNIKAAVDLWCNDQKEAIKIYGHISKWNTKYVTDMSRLFENQLDFNEDIGKWDVRNVTNMSYMFARASSFNQSLIEWNVRSVVDMSFMFAGAVSYNQSLSPWKVDNVRDMKYMFANAMTFNQSLREWNVANVRDMKYMFARTRAFQKQQEERNLEKRRDYSRRFRELDDMEIYHRTPIPGELQTQLFTIPQNSIQRHMFFDHETNSFDDQMLRDAVELWFDNQTFAEYFFGRISKWKTHNVKDMSHLFENKRSFNETIIEWDVSNVINMSYMFAGATSFNQPINRWEVHNVKNMSYMFSNARSFNQYVENWDVRHVSNMRGMLLNASSYDLPLTRWRIDSRETCIDGMFFGASSFH